MHWHSISSPVTDLNAGRVRREVRPFSHTFVDMRNVSISVVGFGAILTALLSGCTSSPSSSAEPFSEPTAAPAAVIEPVPAFESSRPLTQEDCVDNANQRPAAAEEVEQLRGWTLLDPYDRRANPGANGEVVTAEDGSPIAYIVAAGDDLQWIATRFCLRPDWLADINSVRRDATQDLYVGDTLNLDAHTIFTVGDQNGRALSRAVPEGWILPPQR
jgi:hypothetical protein